MANETVTMNIPLEVPQAFIDANGIEVLAQYGFGYKDKIESILEDGQTEVDESGDIVMIDNPLSAEEHIIKEMKAFMKAKAEKAFVAKAEIEAKGQTEQAFNQLMG